MFIASGDLIARWPVYTRRGVLKLTQSEDFPAPVFAVNAGRVKVWDAADIEAYETVHPEVHSQALKTRKIIGYRRAIAKGQAATEGGEHDK